MKLTATPNHELHKAKEEEDIDRAGAEDGHADPSLRGLRDGRIAPATPLFNLFCEPTRSRSSARSVPAQITAFRSLPRGGVANLLERFSLCVDSVAGGDDGGGEHEDSGENIATKDALPRPAFDQLAENERRGHPPRPVPMA